MARIERRWITVLSAVALAVVGLRAVHAVQGLALDDPGALLAFPMTVILPASAFVYVARLRDMVSQEGALMQLGVLIQLILILLLPGFALHLALGFPVVFLVVELFETRAPAVLRDAIKTRILA